MRPHRLEVADVFHAHQEQFLERWGPVLSRQQHKALRDIGLCRTAALDAHLQQCDACSYQTVSYLSCRNRHCPKCQSTARDRWLSRQAASLLPVAYSHAPVAGRLALFRNFDEYGNPFPRPNTLLIDSEQLESGEGLDDNFRSMASDEIERFRREIVERGGKLAEELQGGKELDDVTLLREVMNTVGKYGQLGGSIRYVVSVAMLTEGWDANTVTHVLGVRAFGTQLLCEQVIGRALKPCGLNETHWRFVFRGLKELPVGKKTD